MTEHDESFAAADGASPRAILMVSMEPPATLEDEFNDWYDTEHFPQRRALPGFESASRWVCLEGWPRWMALYDLHGLDALATDAYCAVSGTQSTPWSRRVLPRTIGRRRVMATAVAPQAPLQQASAQTARLVVAGVPVDTHDDAKAVASAAADRVASLPGLLQLRAFHEADAQSDAPHGMTWLIAAFATPVDRAALAPLTGTLAGRGATVFNLYMPYRRGP